jgi:hypothetical protein
MTFSIKNWAKFQHFKDRRPPWVKLYRDLLDDMEWHKLDPKAAKMLVSLWLIASEFEGVLPGVSTLAFRMRTTEKDVTDCVSKLSHWLIQSDITPISDGYQTDTPETETEGETETDGFDLFWQKYPNKKAKPAAARAFKSAKINVNLPDVLADIESRIDSPDWQKEHGQFIPHPATYLNQRRWEDGKSHDAGLGVFL